MWLQLFLSTSSCGSVYMQWYWYLIHISTSIAFHVDVYIYLYCKTRFSRPPSLITFVNFCPNMTIDLMKNSKNTENSVTSKAKWRKNVENNKNRGKSETTENTQRSKGNTMNIHQNINRNAIICIKKNFPEENE